MERKSRNGKRRLGDTQDQIAFLVRTIKALPKRPLRPDAGSNDEIDLTDLPAFVVLADAADDALRQVVAHVHERGASWAEIAGALGVTKSAAFQRFGKS